MLNNHPLRGNCINNKREGGFLAVRRNKKKSFAVIFLFLGVLIGSAGAVILQLQPAPEALPLPSEAQTPRVPDMRQQMSEPEEDNQGKMIFQGYLGIYDERIAIFFGQPPDGTLQYITDYKVREDLREQLAVGVPFRDASELLALLENYTS